MLEDLFLIFKSDCAKEIVGYCLAGEVPCLLDSKVEACVTNYGVEDYGR